MICKDLLDALHEERLGGLYNPTKHHIRIFLSGTWSLAKSPPTLRTCYELDIKCMKWWSIKHENTRKW